VQLGGWGGVCVLIVRPPLILPRVLDGRACWLSREWLRVGCSRSCVCMTLRTWRGACGSAGTWRMQLRSSTRYGPYGAVRPVALGRVLLVRPPSLRHTTCCILNFRCRRKLSPMHRPIHTSLACACMPCPTYPSPAPLSPPAHISLLSTPYCLPHELNASTFLLCCPCSPTPHHSTPNRSKLSSRRRGMMLKWWRKPGGWRWMRFAVPWQNCHRCPGWTQM
jgi:hypothetical protein